jgi:hypothetical protein
MSLISLRVPLEVRGTFKDPTLSPQPGPLVARAALAAALYAIAPPAALLALIETGPGEDVGCRQHTQGHASREDSCRTCQRVRDASSVHTGPAATRAHGAAGSP